MVMVEAEVFECASGTPRHGVQFCPCHSYTESLVVTPSIVIHLPGMLLLLVDLLWKISAAGFG